MKTRSSRTDSAGDRNGLVAATSALAFASACALALAGTATSAAAQSSASFEVTSSRTASASGDRASGSYEVEDIVAPWPSTGSSSSSSFQLEARVGAPEPAARLLLPAALLGAVMLATRRS